MGVKEKVWTKLFLPGCSDPGLNSLKVPYPKFLPTLTNSLSVVSKCLNAQ